MTHTRCWPDPTDHDKQARGEVVGDHVEGHLPGQHQLEPGGAVVHPDGLVVGVAWVQGLEGDLVIQDGLDAIVIRNKLKAILYCIVLDIKRKSYLRQEGNFTHWIVETANFELADLEIEDVFFLQKSVCFTKRNVWRTTMTMEDVLSSFFWFLQHLYISKNVVFIFLINGNEAKCPVSRINYGLTNSVWAVTWISIGNELNLIGQMNVIRVARAYITSRLESIQIPEHNIMNEKLSLKLSHNPLY